MREQFVDDHATEAKVVRTLRGCAAGEAHDIRATIEQAALRHVRHLLGEGNRVNSQQVLFAEENRISFCAQFEIHVVCALSELLVRDELPEAARGDEAEPGYASVGWVALFIR